MSRQAICRPLAKVLLPTIINLASIWRLQLQYQTSQHGSQRSRCPSYNVRHLAECCSSRREARARLRSAIAASLRALQLTELPV